jgi:hypothetical protein
MADDPNVRSGPALGGRERKNRPKPRSKRPTIKGLPLPPGLAKRAAGARSAKAFAPGQIKKGLPAPPLAKGWKPGDRWGPGENDVIPGAAGQVKPPGGQADSGKRGRSAAATRTGRLLGGRTAPDRGAPGGPGVGRLIGPPTPIPGYAQQASTQTSGGTAGFGRLIGPPTRTMRRPRKP